MHERHWPPHYFLMVKCNAGHLVRLDLTNFGLLCDFPTAEMAAFQYVTELYFQGNALTVRTSSEHFHTRRLMYEHGAAIIV